MAHRRVYLDVCCLNRPTDDLSIDRNRLEAEAVLAIVAHASQGDWDIVTSAVVEYEVQQCAEPLRRRAAEKLVSVARSSVTIGQKHHDRAAQLVQLGFGQLDALHIAAAELGRCHVMLSTDDRLLKRAARNPTILLIRVENPLNWLLEQDDAHYTDDAR